jgi:hypothetical protein
MSVLTSTILFHDPSDVLDYGIDWTAQLAAGETIATSLWTVMAGTATLGNSAADGSPSTSKAGTITSAVTTVWMLTASAGLVTLRNRIVTSASRQYDQTVFVRVEDQ